MHHMVNLYPTNFGIRAVVHYQINSVMVTAKVEISFSVQIL